MGYQEQAAALGAAADAEITALNASAAALSAQLDDAEASVAARDETIAQLRARIAELENPTPPVDPGPVDPPPPAGDGRPKLRWAPPQLTNPTTLNVGSALPKLDPAKDYILKLPTDRAITMPGGLVIEGGRNVVVIGGQVDVTGANGVRRAAYLKNNAGTVHVEGVRFRAVGGDFTEGIDNASPASTVQIENVHVDGLCSGTQATNHADILQTWNGPRTLRVDGLKGRTNYQAAFLNAHDLNTVSAPVEGSWELHRCDFESVDGKYTLWLVPPPGSVKTSQVHCWGPSAGEWKPAMWPGILHTKPTEDFTGGAGLGYTTPGYVQAGG